MLLRLLRLASHLSLRLRGDRPRRLEGEGCSLVVHRFGPPNGEPWVLLHGLGATAAVWHPVIAALAPECRLLVPELSGLGGSRIDGGLGIGGTAAAVARLVDEELGGRPVTVAGISLGGWVAVRLTQTRPERVERLVLIDAAGYRHQDWEAIEDVVRLESPADLDALYRALFARVPPLFRWGRRAFYRVYTSPAVTDTLADLDEADAFDDADLARIAAPATLVWGERDGLFTAEVARAMAAALPEARLTVLPGCGHTPHWECPDRLVEVLRALRRDDRRSSPTPPPAAPAGRG